MTIDPLVKIVLTHGASSYTYDRDRILSRKHTEGPYSQTATVVLDNSDGALTDLALQGFRGVISYGAIGGAGEEYSACAPLWVIPQQLNSSPGTLDCTLQLIGIPNWLALDKASRNYIPDENDTKTIETLLIEILEASLGCFSHCKAYDVVVDSRDSLINTYKPKDSLRIYKGNSRLAIAKRLLDCTKCVMIAKADGKLHIFVPQTTGTPVYTYSLEAGHTFFSKAHRKTLVIPNYIYASSPPHTVPNWVIVTSAPYSGEAKDQADIDKFGERKHTTDFGAGNLGSDAECAEFAQIELDRYIALHDPYYEGIAYDQESIDALKTDTFSGEIRAYWQASFESDDQAKLVAEAMLAKVKLNAEMGAADVPLNVGAEVYDYVKVAAFCAEDVYRVGTTGSLTRHYNAEEAEWRMSFSLGQRPEAVDVMTIIEQEAPYFGRLIVDNLYAKNILADSLDMAWIDPDNTIDLSKIGDDLDNLPDGEVYARVKTLHLDAGQIKLNENILYSSGYNPTSKFDLGAHSLDNIPEGVTYQRAKSAALTAAGLVILDKVVVGTYGLVRSTDIIAGHIILQECEGDLDDIDEGGTYGKLKQTDIDSGHIKLTSYVKVSGEWYNESGVEIDASHGINIYGTNQALTTRATKTGTIQCKVDTSGRIVAGAGSVELDAGGINIFGKANALTTRATRTGTIQCYVGSDGRIYAGAGAVILDSGGITIKGEKLTLQNSGGGYSAELYIDSSGNLRLDPWGYVKVKHILPVSDYAYWLGNVDNSFRRIYGNPVVPTTGDATEGAIKIKGAGSGDIYVYSNGTWRANT